MAANDTRESLVDPGKCNPRLGRLAVRLLVGDSNPKTLRRVAAAAAANPATEKESSVVRGQALSYIDTPADVQRVSRPPVGSSRLSVTSAAPPNESRAGSTPSSSLEVTPAWRGSNSHAPHVIGRKHRRAASKPSGVLSATSSNASSVFENLSREDSMGDYFDIMERFVEAPEEMQYVRAVEAGMRNRKGDIRAGADSAKLGGGGRGKEFAHQNTPASVSHRRELQPTIPQPSSKESLPATAQIPAARLQHLLPPQNISAGGSAPASSPPPPPQQHHHHTRSDMLEYESPSHSMRETRPVTARGSRPAHACLSRGRSRSLTERSTTVRLDQAAVTISRSGSIAARISAGKCAASASQEQWEQRREQREQRQEQRQEPQRRLHGSEPPQQQELELLVDALKAELRVKDQLLEASENERKLLEEELRSAWEHVGELEQQLQDAAAAMQRELDARRTQGGCKRGGSEGDLAVGNFVIEMERALAELARKLEAKDNALQLSEGQNAELTAKVTNREFELSRTKSALRQAEQERDWVVEEMEAALASWTAGGPDIQTAVDVPSPAEAEKQEVAKLANALEAAQRELQVVKSRRDLVLMAVERPKRQDQDQPSQQDRMNRKFDRKLNRSLTPSPVHSRPPSRSLTCSRSGPLQLLHDRTIEPSHMAAAHRRSRYKGFPPHPADLKVAVN